MLSCGKSACSTELRARKVRGNEYGNRGGGPQRTEDVTYNGAHARARRSLAGQPCALADDSCQGRLEVALRFDAPRHLLRLCGKNQSHFFVGVVSEDGYRTLCRSHHGREGALMGVIARLSSRELARAVLDDLGYPADA